MASADGDGPAQSVDLIAAEIVFDHKSRHIGRKTPGGFIESYCQKERHGGGDVLQTIHPWQGDESRALVVFDPEICKPDIVQSLAKKLKPPIQKIVEFSEGQCFGKGSIFVSPRLKEKLLKHFEADKIFNNLYSEAGIAVNADSWCLTGYFFQLKLAEDCLKRLEGEADRKGKAGGDEHLQDTSKEDLPPEVSEDAKKRLKPTPRSRVSAPKPSGPVLPSAEASPDDKAPEVDPTNAAPVIPKVSNEEEDTKKKTVADKSDKLTPSTNPSSDNQSSSAPASLLTSRRDNLDQPPSGARENSGAKNSSLADPIPPEVEETNTTKNLSHTDPTSPGGEDSAVDTIQQPLILTHQLKKPKLGLPASFISGSEPSRQESLTEDEKAENALNTSPKSPAIPDPTTKSAVPDTTTVTSAQSSIDIPNQPTPARKSAPTTTDNTPVTLTATSTIALSTTPNISAVATSITTRAKSALPNKKTTTFFSNPESGHPDSTTTVYSGISKEPKTRSTTAAQAANIPLPPDDDFETEKSGERKELENSAVEADKTNTTAEAETSKEPSAVEVQSNMKRIKTGSSSVCVLEEEFDGIYYEFMTSVWKEKFQRKVTEKFGGKISCAVNSKDNRVLTVIVSHRIQEQTTAMMAALNKLYTRVIRTVHSHNIKLQYEGDKGRLAKALEQDLPDLYPGEELVARLVTSEDIRIIGFLKNIDHDIHIVETFVSDFKKRHPAPPAPKIKSSEIPMINGIVVKVIQGDLTKVKYDAIVSSSGHDLSHKRGVSRAIANACGQRFMAEGRKHIQKNGNMKICDTYTQKADGRPKAYGVQFVIHVIAPPFSENTLETQQLLKKAMVNALVEADKLNCRSVGLPAICAGNMGVPIDVCAECYWNAVMIFGTQTPSSTLKEIVFLVDDSTIVKKIDAVFKHRSTSPHAPSSSAAELNPPNSASSAGNSANVVPDVHKSQKFGQTAKGAEKGGIGSSAHSLIHEEDLEEPLVDKSGFMPLDMGPAQDTNQSAAGKMHQHQMDKNRQRYEQKNTDSSPQSVDDRTDDPYGLGHRQGAPNDRRNDSYGDGGHELGDPYSRRNDSYGVGRGQGAADDRRNDPYGVGRGQGAADDRRNDPYGVGRGQGATDDRRNDPYGVGRGLGAADDRRKDPYGVGRGQGAADDRRNDPYGVGRGLGAADDRRKDPYGVGRGQGAADDRRNDPYGVGRGQGAADDRRSDPYGVGRGQGAADDRRNDPYGIDRGQGAADDRRKDSYGIDRGLGFRDDKKSDPYGVGRGHGIADDRRIRPHDRYVEFQGASYSKYGMGDRNQGSVEPGNSRSWALPNLVTGAISGAVSGVSSLWQGFDDNQAISHLSTHTSGNGNPATSSAGSAQPKDSECPICMDDFTDPKTLPCTHTFCRNCLDQVVNKGKSNLCPTCRAPFTQAEGKQPKGGRMSTNTWRTHLPGHKDCGHIEIAYSIPSGIQGPEHPHPGQGYTGTSRTAYLPDNTKGRLVARLLRKAFDQRLVFTVGQSVTTGMDNCVVWNDIHHKTNKHGGPSGYGYPDPDYLDRVIEDLKAKGVTE